MTAKSGIYFQFLCQQGEIPPCGAERGVRTPLPPRTPPGGNPGIQSVNSQAGTFSTFEQACRMSLFSFAGY